MKINNKILLLFWIIIVSIILSACKGDSDKNISENLSLESDIIVDNNRIESNENISSQETVTQQSDDIQDPENTDSKEQQGQKIEAEHLVSQTGKAYGIDVSKWQGKIDWTKVKNSGIDFAIIRIGFRGENGTIYKDTNADYNIQQAQNAGILVGVYFFSTAINSAEATEEAHWALSAIKGYSISYPVMYDCEGFNLSNSRMNKLTKTERTDNALAFLSVVKNAGYDTMFYASKSDLENFWETSRISSACKILIAQYTQPTYPEKSSPDYSGKFDMWQYTNRGNVSGIKGNVDMLVSYFTCTKSKPKDSSVTPITADTPKTAEEMIYTDVIETITAKEKVNLRSGAGTNFDIVATLENGVTLTRTGVGTNGWSRLIYNDKTVYAITSYLTTDLSYKVTTTPAEDIVAGNTFTATNDKVTAKETVNLRSLPTTNSDIIATIKNGEFLQRTAISNKGWSRLDYNGNTVYAISSYLTTDATPKPEIKPENNSSMVFDIVDEQVTAKSETNLRTSPSTIDSEIVYTLKNGEYIHCTGVSNSGWSKLEYNGQTVYAISSYLTK